MKSSRTILLAVIFSIFAAFLTVKMMVPETGIVKNEAKKESVYDRVMRTGTLRCGYALSQPQMMKDPNTGKLSGVDYDVWEAIGKQLNVKIEWTEEVGWGNFIEGLRTSHYDAFCSNIWADYARTKLLTLTIPTIYSFVQTYVRAD
ncbi:MAG: amino acid transporter substrate-binding protein family, partial [Alphaproteobacteria bacterium]|nr:amino acid transporter substrate-binding protein family [Alphaproteobacteria bacterium]